MPIDEQYIALMQLPCGQQPGECADDIPLDGALQVAGSIPLVGALRQEELSAFARDSKQKGACCRVQHALLYLPEFNVKHFVKLRALQRMKHDHLVQTVHELRRELPSCCLHRSPLHLLMQSGCGLVLRLDESHPSVHQIGDLAASQVRGQEDHCLRQIHSPVIAQRQRCFIEHSEQQLPQRVAGFLNFVKQQKAQFEPFAM